MVRLFNSQNFISYNIYTLESIWNDMNYSIVADAFAFHCDFVRSNCVLQLFDVSINFVSMIKYTASAVLSALLCEHQLRVYSLHSLHTVTVATHIKSKR